jgi:hypothetical protein
MPGVAISMETRFSMRKVQPNHGMKAGPMNDVQRKRRGEHGQAIAELCIALVAISAIFVGVIFMLAVGQANIENLLTVRGEADAGAISGLAGGTGTPISQWDAGGDGRMFTNDDEPMLVVSNEAALFRGELNSGSYDLATDLSPVYVPENFARDLSDDLMFLHAADLARGSASVDPFSYFAIEDLRGAFRSLIYGGEITVGNEVYMPVFGESGD